METRGATRSEFMREFGPSEEELLQRTQSSKRRENLAIIKQGFYQVVYQSQWLNN